MSNDDYDAFGRSIKENICLKCMKHDTDKCPLNNLIINRHMGIGSKVYNVRPKHITKCSAFEDNETDKQCQDCIHGRFYTYDFDFISNNKIWCDIGRGNSCRRDRTWKYFESKDCTNCKHGRILEKYGDVYCNISVLRNCFDKKTWRRYEYKENKKENICNECVKKDRSDCPFYNKKVTQWVNNKGELHDNYGPRDNYDEKIIKEVIVKPKTIKSCSSFKSQQKQDYIDTVSSMSEALKKQGYTPNNVVYDIDLKEHEIIGRAITSVKKNDKKQQFWAKVDLYNEEGKCYNKKTKGGNDMSKIEQEIEKKQKKIEKVKKLIENEEKKRNERIEEIQELIKKENLSHKNGNVWVSREFIDYIIEKEDLCIKKKKKRSKSKFKDICIILDSLSLKIKEYGYNIEYGKNPFDFKSKELIKTSRDDWNKIEEAFLLIEKHADEYILNTYQKKLCFLTDCYKKLATEKFCKKCASSNPIEAIYCNHCGEKL